MQYAVFYDVIFEASKNVGTLGHTQPVFPVSVGAVLFNKAVALLVPPHFHFECLSCSLEVVNVDCGVGINKHDGCVLPLSEPHSDVCSLDTKINTAFLN